MNQGPIYTALRYPTKHSRGRPTKNATATQSPRLLEVPSVCCLQNCSESVFLPPKKIYQDALENSTKKIKHTHFPGFFLGVSVHLWLQIAKRLTMTDPTNSAELTNLCALPRYGDRISIFSSYPFQVSLRMKVGTHTYYMI